MSVVRVAVAGDADFQGFIALAGEVEEWFGPMIDEPGFHGAVRKSIARGSALVALDGSEHIGAMLFSRHSPPRYEIGWLVVTAARRSQGVGEALVGRAVRDWVELPALLTVVTFGRDHPGARSRGFYERLGFVETEPVEPGPDGGSRDRFERSLTEIPAWAC